MSLTPEEVVHLTDQMALAMTRALQQARSVSDSEHFAHHVWITKQIEREQLRTEFWRQMLAHVAKWGVVSVVSATVFALYLGVKAWMKAHGW